MKTNVGKLFSGKFLLKCFVEFSQEAIRLLFMAH